MHRVTTLIGPHASMFELAVPCEVFGIHRPEVAGWDYGHVVCSPVAVTQVGQGGLTLHAERGLDAVAEADTVVVPPWEPTPGHFDDDRARSPVGTFERGAGWHADDDPPDEVLDALRAAHDRGARLV